MNSYVKAMAGPSNTLLIEGTFEELSEELAQYLDTLRKAHGDENSSLATDIAPFLTSDNKTEALKKLVIASAALNVAPERGAPSPSATLIMSHISLS